MDPRIEIAILRRVEAEVQAVDARVQALNAKIDKLAQGLATHKAKTSVYALLTGGVASLLVAIGAVLLKGCV